MASFRRSGRSSWWPWRSAPTEAGGSSPAPRGGGVHVADGSFWPDEWRPVEADTLELPPHALVLRSWKVATATRGSSKRGQRRVRFLKDLREPFGEQPVP